MKLQNNYTTPEQSQRLLDLGVPADSADCYWNDICERPFTLSKDILYSDERNQFTKANVPVWSVGRLMEILRKCIERDDDKEVIFMDLTYKQGPIINLLMDVFEDRPVMDLSKLED